MTTADLTRKCGEIEQKLATHDEKISNLSEKVEAVETEQKEQRRMLVVIERIANGLENVKEKVDDICVRVSHIEEKPGKRWESFVGQIIGIIVAAVAGYLLSKAGM